MVWNFKANIRGPQGPAVESAVIGGDDHLRLTLSNGSVLDAGVARGVQGLPGVNAVANDTATATYVEGPSATRTALDAAFASHDGTRSLTIENPGNLARWEAALADAGSTPAVVVVHGDSISWGIGSDDDSNDTGNNTVYRQDAWPVVLRKLMARAHGTPVAENWIGSTIGWGYVTVVGGTTSQTVGPFGQVTDRGGMGLADVTQSITIPASLSGRFTSLDVLHWGLDSGVSLAGTPSVLIDGVVKVAGSGTHLSGNLLKSTITGLADSTHEIVVKGPPGTSTFIPGIIPRYDKGVVVNRIAISGATTTAAAGGTLTTAAKQRNIDSAVLKDYSDLVVIALGANDLTNQIPLVEFTANLQALVASAVAGGACVLLLAGPPVNNGETYTITETQYREAMQDISNTTSHVAYLDVSPVFGDRAVAFADGMFPAAGTVHPSKKGHRVMGEAVFAALPLASV